MVKKMIKMGVTNLVGIGLIGATAGMANELPAGTAKTIAGIVPGLQSVALVSKNIPDMKISTKKQKGLSKSKHKKSLW